jgi:hypothetical protein
MSVGSWAVSGREGVTVLADAVPKKYRRKRPLFIGLFDLEPPSNGFFTSLLLAPSPPNGAAAWTLVIAGPYWTFD